MAKPCPMKEGKQKRKKEREGKGLHIGAVCKFTSTTEPLMEDDPYEGPTHLQDHFFWTVPSYFHVDELLDPREIQMWQCLAAHFMHLAEFG